MTKQEAAPKFSAPVWYREDPAGEWVKGVRHWYSADAPNGYGQGPNGREPIQTRFECVECRDDDYMYHVISVSWWRPRNETDNRPGDYRREAP